MNSNRWNLNKSQRMQLKAFICFLGFLLLVLLLLGRVILALLHRGNGEEESLPQEPPPHVPVVQLYTNVWIMEVGEDGLMIFRDGAAESYPWGMSAQEGREELYRADISAREQVADVELTDGEVTSVTVKGDKINGRILSVDDEGMEVEGYGRLPLAADYKGYRLYDSLEMCTARDVFFGYDYTDLCMDDGEICGVLMVKEDAMEYIRVLIKAPDYNGSYHDHPLVTCDTDFTVEYGSYEDRKQEKHSAGEELEFSYDSSYFEGGRVLIAPDVLTGKVVFRNCSRSQGIPAYRGQMELLRTEDGIVAVNEVLLEEYLYSVVPSEMPSKYPFEALKAQAICARTYAYGHMKHAGFPEYGAHVDDSTSYQVYNNILEQESTTSAVKETYGQLLMTEYGDPAGTYYYSTSCGVGSDPNVWKTQAAPALTYLKGKSLSREAMASYLAGNGSPEGENDPGEALKEEEAFAEFISRVNGDDFEAGESWYRWSYRVETLDRKRILENLQKRYAANSKLVLTWKDGAYVSETIEKLEDIREIYIEKRGCGGVADELVIETVSQKFKVISEHCIRYVLNDGDAKVVRQDGSAVASPNLLPSGFFVIETAKDKGLVTGYSLTGGGFGHGVGMSQNGAKEMAGYGYSAGEILLYFYEDCIIQNVYE